MKFYIANNKLIKLNLETNVYRICNTVESGNKTITKEEFDLLNPKQIKKQKFFELLNMFFKNIKHEWRHDYSYFKKLENFDNNLKSNELSWSDLPNHNLDKFKNCDFKLIYYHGKVYYIFNNSQYGTRTQLVDTKNHNIVQWCDVKNTAPIFNIGTKKVV